MSKVSKLFSTTLIGLDTQIIEVEVDIRKGKNKINIVGLPDKAVTEAKERILPAIKNSNCIFPKGLITVNLAPADIPKTGAIYDLPIAVGILIASRQLRFDINNKVFAGELSLDGKLRSINGVISIVDGGYRKGFKEFFIPSENIDEACLVKGAINYPVSSINQILDHFNYKPIKKGVLKISHTNLLRQTKYDLKYVKGQEHARRALEIAASGGHNLLFTGVPGSGKTFLSRCLPGILTDLTFQESIEVTRIYSVTGLLPKSKPLISERPFRAPHHTSSQVALVGGGTYPKPGEVTLAHRGVLFLDEFPEFDLKALEVLRQPLEDKIVNISRANGTISFPASFMLVAAMNPCKCGFRGDPQKDCVCTASEFLRYQKRISGPILDRIDLQIKVPKVNISKLTSNRDAESSIEVRARVKKVRDIQRKRFQNAKELTINSDMSQYQIKENVRLNKSSLEILKTAIDSLNLSARSYYKILKVARTIADIEGSESVRKDHIAESISYRL